MAPEGKSDHYHREASQPMDGDVARIQMDFKFVGAEGTFVDEPETESDKSHDLQRRWQPVRDRSACEDR